MLFIRCAWFLPKTIEKVVAAGGDEVKIPHDSVLSELKRIAAKTGEADEDIAMAMAVYLLGFSTYAGFEEVAATVIDDKDENRLKRLYEYAKRRSDVHK